MNSIRFWVVVLFVACGAPQSSADAGTDAGAVAGGTSGGSSGGAVAGGTTGGGSTAGGTAIAGGTSGGASGGGSTAGGTAIAGGSAGGANGGGSTAGGTAIAGGSAGGADGGGSTAGGTAIAGGTSGASGGSAGGSVDAGPSVRDAGTPLDAGVRYPWLALVPPSSITAPPAVPGPVVVVVPPGTGTDPGAFTSLVAAVAAVADGGTVLVEDGVYPGPLTFGASRARINVLARSGRPTIDCSTTLINWTQNGTHYETIAPHDVSAVFVDGQPLQRARYPASGFATVAATDSAPSGPFRRVATQPTDWATLSTQPLSNALVTVRVVDWLYNSATIARLDGGALLLGPNALASECTHASCGLEFPALQGWGYYLENEAWMLTQPGWAFEPGTRRLRVRLAAGSPAQHRISASAPVDCVTLAATENVTLSGITITNAGRDGMYLESATGARLHRVEVTNTARMGVVISNTDPFIVDESHVANSGTRCVLHGIPWFVSPLDSVFESNVIERCGRFGSPKESSSGIQTWPSRATQLVYRHNVFRENAGVGVWLAAGSRLEENTFVDHCLSIDDCGAVYGSGYTPGAHVRRNVIRGVHAALAGKGRGAYPANGIYLDDHATQFIVDGNQITDVDIGVFLHNSYSMQVRNNVVLGASRGSVFTQEDTNRHVYNVSTQRFDPVLVNGMQVPSMAANEFSGNWWVVPPLAVPVTHDSYLRQGVDGLLAAYTGHDTSYFSFFTHRSVVATSGTRELVDVTRLGIDSSPFSPRVSDAITVSNEQSDLCALSAATASSFATYTPTGTVSLTNVACPEPSTSGVCLRVDTTASGLALLISPAFAVTAGELYRVRLQLRTASGRIERLSGTFREGGPTSYDDLNTLREPLGLRAEASGWTSRNLYVRSRSSVARARFDLEIPANHVVIIGAIEVTPVTGPEATFTDRVFGAVNASFVDVLDAGCPVGGCAGWLEADGGAAVGPLLIQPRRTGLRFKP